MSRSEMAFNLMWEDSNKESHKIGIFAQTKNHFYLVMSNDESIENIKKETGYVDPPGLRAGTVYRSKKVFDFIERRLDKSEFENPGEAIIKRNGARSFTDSFYFEAVPNRLTIMNIIRIRRMYELQEKIKELSARTDL